MPFKWIRFLHIASALGFMGIHGASIVVLYVIRREIDRTRIESLMGFSAKTVVAMYVSLVAVVGTIWPDGDDVYNAVVLLEAGPLKTSSQFDMQERAAYRDLYQEGTGRGTKDGGMVILQGRSVGGSTTVNWTTSFRTPPETLKFWAEHMGVTGCSEDELAPHFAHMEERLSVAEIEAQAPAFDRCVDADAGYGCACKPGYEGNGFVCADVDEWYLAMVNSAVRRRAWRRLRTAISR